MAQFTNQAQLSYGNSVTNSNIAVGEIMEVLSASKTAVGSTYGQNEKVTYVISAVNAGTLPLSGLVLTDDLGAYPFGEETVTPLTYVDGSVRYFINGILQAAPAVTAGGPLEISGITIPAGGNTIIIYETETNQFAPVTEGAEIRNTAVLSGTGTSPVTVTATITAESAPLLTITKSISPIPVTENGTLTYTFLIQNSGNSPVDVSEAAVIRDVFDPLLSNLAVSFNGAVWTEGTNYNYDETTGIFTTVPGQITVPAAAFTQDPVTGAWVVDPGMSTLVITGTL